MMKRVRGTRTHSRLGNVSSGAGLGWMDGGWVNG